MLILIFNYGSTNFLSNINFFGVDKTEIKIYFFICIFMKRQNFLLLQLVNKEPVMEPDHSR